MLKYIKRLFSRKEPKPSVDDILTPAIQDLCLFDAGKTRPQWHIDAYLTQYPRAPGMTRFGVFRRVSHNTSELYYSSPDRAEAERFLLSVHDLPASELSVLLSASAAK